MTWCVLMIFFFFIIDRLSFIFDMKKFHFIFLCAHMCIVNCPHPLSLLSIHSIKCSVKCPKWIKKKELYCDAESIYYTYCIGGLYVQCWSIIDRFYFFSSLIPLCLYYWRRTNAFLFTNIFFSTVFSSLSNYLKHITLFSLSEWNVSFLTDKVKNIFLLPFFVLLSWY